MNLKDKLLDWYFNWPKFTNLIIIVVAYMYFVKKINVDHNKFDINLCLNIISSIISACISLAGFILAALTIIVTFKSSLKAKKIQDSENGIEIILEAV